MEPSLAFLVAFGILGSTYAQDFYIAAPSILRVNSESTVAIAVDGDSEALVNVYIQDYPGKGKNISQEVVQIQPGLPKILKIRLDVKHFPDNFFTAPESTKLVSLNAHFLNTHKEIVIPVSSESGFAFIQADKSIYTPKQSALFTIIPLTEEALPSNELFQIQIRNPNNIIVEEGFFNEKNRKLTKVFANYIYRFPTYPVFGEWSATVRFGHNLEQNSTVRFMLREYVLPTFNVKLKTPDVILPNDPEITVEVTASHVYGKKVKGSVSFRLGVKSEHAEKTVYFEVVSPKELDEGQYTLKIKTDILKSDKYIGWFPGIDKSHLVVKATVIDYATGDKEEVTDSKAIFSKSLFIISCRRCFNDFKPGIASVFEADISYVDGRPAQGILAKLTAVAINGKPMIIHQNTTRSDENGRVALEFLPKIEHKTVWLMLDTIDPNYGENQVSDTFEQFAYESPSNAFIAISRSRTLRLKPGDKYETDISFEPVDLKNIHYLVKARGKILDIRRLEPGFFKQQRVHINVTSDMVPYFWVVVFAHHNNELVADSLKIEVDSECNPKAQVTIDHEFNVKEPGCIGKMIIRGTKDTFVQLLGVDEALFRKDALTKTQIFDKLVSHDSGCGPGGGLNVNEVLGNAGITLATNKYSSLSSYSCDENKRRKREIQQSIGQSGVIPEGMVGNGSDGFNHMDAYLESEMADQMWAGNSEEPEFIEEDLQDAFEIETMIRCDMRETWFYENIHIGMDGKKELALSLPHAITSWVVHAVSLSPLHGICVSDINKLVSQKKLFLHLNLPYSVVQNEQIVIQATVFNYGNHRVGAIVYMYGAKGLCSGFQSGQKSEKKRLIVEAKSASSVSFPVIPLITGNIPIKVILLSPSGTDAIEKELYVVPEGVTKEIEIPIKLDPLNLQQRKKMYIETPLYSDYIHTTQNLQATIVKLSAPEGFLPGTESCSVSVIGDKFDPFVEASNNITDRLFQKPHGNGEENMMLLAPTVHTMMYLEVRGKLTPDSETKGYVFIRHGYDKQLSFMKNDGSFASDQSKQSSTWLTAFVIKVFSQVKTLIDIDENIICSGVRWLIRNQEPDGSYVEKHPIQEVDMMGGVNGSASMTAFILIALEQCKCNEEGLLLTKTRAVAYLETHLEDLNKPLSVAIAAYALALSNSSMKQDAYNKLQSMAEYNEDSNWMYWSTDNSAQDVETTGYGLLTELIFNDLGNTNLIVNWLNSKQFQSGSFKSTQETVVSLQALSEYTAWTKLFSVNLVSNISLSNDRNFDRVLRVHEENAHILQDVKVDRTGGNLFIKTTGQGMGSLSVKLRYNVIQPVQDVCKFDVTVNIKNAENTADSKNRRVKRQNQDDSSKLKLNITLCLRYMGNADAELSIVDVGVFSGFYPVEKDLEQFVKDPTHSIIMFETSSRGVIFHLEKVPVAKNYCFSFSVIRKYLVGKEQTSVIKVYEYYNPDATCTKFYSPVSNSSLIRTICVGSVCDCVQGGCPPKNPFMETYYLSSEDMRYRLMEIFCGDYDYVWKGRLDGRIRKEGGFYNISFYIEEVIKEGIDSELSGETRTLLALDSCQTVLFLMDTTYLVLGKDGSAYNNGDGDVRYRYILDQTSVVYHLRRIVESPNKQLERSLRHVMKSFERNGCDD